MQPSGAFYRMAFQELEIGPKKNNWTALTGAQSLPCMVACSAMSKQRILYTTYRRVSCRSKGFEPSPTKAHPSPSYMQESRICDKIYDIVYFSCSEEKSRKGTTTVAADSGNTAISFGFAHTMSVALGSLLALSLC